MKKVKTARLAGIGGRPYDNKLGEIKFGYLVSVGKENFSGYKLSSTLGLIYTEMLHQALYMKLEKTPICYIIVAGTLQRFNIASQKAITPEEAYNESKALEDEWIANCKELISKIDKIVMQGNARKCKVDFKFVRWDDLRNDTHFQHNLTIVQQKCKSNDSFNQDMQNSINEYALRQIDKDQSKVELFAQNSRHFLEEECACLCVIAHILDISHLLYPGSCTDILDATINSEELVNKIFFWIQVKFKDVNIDINNKLVYDYTEFKAGLSFLTDSEYRNKFIDTACLQVDEIISQLSDKQECKEESSPINPVENYSTSPNLLPTTCPGGFFNHRHPTKTEVQVGLPIEGLLGILEEIRNNAGELQQSIVSKSKKGGRSQLVQQLIHNINMVADEINLYSPSSKQKSATVQQENLSEFTCY